MSSRLSSEYWRERGEEARALASAVIDEKLQLSLLVVADEYYQLAEFTEEHERRRPAALWPHADD